MALLPNPKRGSGRAGKLGRHVDHYRPVHGWSTQEVWGLWPRVGERPANRVGERGDAAPGEAADVILDGS